MDIITEFAMNIYSIIKTFNPFDLLDIVLIAYLVYKAIKMVRETRAEQLVKGVFLLAISYFLSWQFGLKTMTFLLKNVFQIGFIALIIVFQPELRRALEKVGRTKVVDLSVFNSDSNDKKDVMWTKPINVITQAVGELSRMKTGALLVIEQKTKLGEQIATGVLINAHMSAELIGNIFVVNTPLHDGATIIRDGRIIASACFLPKPQKEELIATNLGSRHRAAIGISEISDSITIIVSEETGRISVAHNGILTRDYSPITLNEYLRELLIPTKEVEESNKPKFWRFNK